jgi:hypothetical protein
VWDEEFLMMATGDVLSLRGAKDSVFTENWGLVVAVPEIVVAVEDRLRSAFQEGALV